MNSKGEETKTLINRFVCIVLLAVSSASAEEYVIAEDESVFAVVTQRGGVASRFAHNHFIAADGYQATLEAVDGQVNGFTFECDAEELLVDNPSLREQWEETLSDAGLIDINLSKVSESDQAKIRKHMLAEDQLFAEEHPTIKVEASAIRDQPSTHDDREYSHMAEVDFTVHGKTVTRELPVNIRVVDGAIEIDTSVAYRFTDFDIEPYRAMFGAVKNKDEFFLVCVIKATPQN